jgi:heme exporter protein D
MENSQNAGGSATPDLSASVQATKLSNPVQVASASESISSTPNEVDYSENSGSSKIDIGQWISIGIIGLTIVALVVQIVVARRTLIKLNEEDKQLKEDVTDLKIRVENVESKQTTTRRAA